MTTTTTNDLHLAASFAREAVEAAGASFPLLALSAVRDAELALVAARSQLVEAARAGGCSWSEVAEALGVTKQAAQQRYGR